jgi:2-polyprenyl-3-methyl-5-hydroxy-6-metoxy-1,4-benzoquinol methylase
MLTARQKREQAYYDEYANTYKQDVEVAFGPIEGRERRPWNPYWYLFGRVKDAYRPGARLLDFGCGWGENAVVFAKIGYDVQGFDLSGANLQAARRLADRYGLGSRMHLSRQAAEGLAYADGAFDVVVGVDILHHVDIPRAIRECHRVLKPGGLAFFKEPVTNWLFDTVRNLGLVKKLRPNSVSFDRHVTEDERKLNGADLKTIRRIFTKMDVMRFRVISRLDALLPGAMMLLEKVDYWCSILPGYARLRGTVILCLRK